MTNPTICILPHYTEVSNSPMYRVTLHKQFARATFGDIVIVHMSLRSLPSLLFAIGLCQLAGIVGSIPTGHAIRTWYTVLVKPAQTPPGWIFAPVWTILYTLMGISLFIIWKTRTKHTQQKTETLMVFYTHLAVNALWSLAFFGLRSPLAGLVTTIILLILVSIVLWQFYRLNRFAGIILVPYIVWVSFATFLNGYIWWLNG